MSVKIRLMGLPEDVEAAAAALRTIGLVVEESSDYANRGNSLQVRRYLEVVVEATAPPPVVTVTVARDDQAPRRPRALPTGR